MDHEIRFRYVPAYPWLKVEYEIIQNKPIFATFMSRKSGKLVKGTRIDCDILISKWENEFRRFG